MLHTITKIDNTLIPNIIWQDESLTGIITDFNNHAHNMGYVWKYERNWLFSGYWVNPVNGDAFLIDYPIQS